MANLEDLIVPETAEGLDETQLALAQANDLPATSWKTGSTARELMRTWAETLADAWYSVAQIANGVILELATGAWLTRWGTSQYDDARIAAEFTRGTFVVTDNGGGPHTVTAGQTIFATEGQTLKFRATSSGTVNLNDSLSVDVVAFAAGSASNLPNDASLEIVSSMPTATVTNPEIGVTGTWITTLGADVESDQEMRARLPLKWATLSTGSPPDAYLSKALALVGVTRAKLDDRNPDGPGTNRLYIDNAGVVAAAQTLLDAWVPSGTTSTAYAATSQVVTVPATLTVRRDYRVAVEAAHTAALVQLASEIDIGGTVVKSELIERLMAPAGMFDVAIGSTWAAVLPSQNIELSANGIPQFSASFTYVEV
ncbi:MAG: baseplate J/gp47 family protein [Alsobacter sp.]